MNYRFTLQAEVRQLTGRFGVTQVLAYCERDREKRPTDYIAAVYTQGIDRVLDEFRWGLLPFWAKNSVQADGLTMLANKSFDYGLKRQRCVIPCSSYSRYIPEQGRRKAEQLMLHQGEMLAMAGVYDIRLSPQGEELRACTILSVRKAAPGQDEDVPILLGAKQIEAWLSPDFMDKRSVIDLVEAIAESQPKSLLLPAGAAVTGGSEGGLEPFPA
jgi:putative SOS response-associated peptidase YedK